MYYPDTRPGLGPVHGRGVDQRPVRRTGAGCRRRSTPWRSDRLIEESIAALERFIPGVGAKIDWMEAATPRTIERYTTHFGGTSFGTKFEGLKVSMDLPEQLPGLYHAGSVGIIMSGWLGTINYGVITANKVDRYVCAQRPEAGRHERRLTQVTDRIPHRPPFLFVDEIVSETRRRPGRPPHVAAGRGLLPGALPGRADHARGAALRGGLPGRAPSTSRAPPADAAPPGPACRCWSKIRRRALPQPRVPGRHGRRSR